MGIFLFYFFKKFFPLLEMRSFDRGSVYLEKEMQLFFTRNFSNR